MPDDGPRWHPVLNAEERSPGRWVLVASFGDEYGEIEIRRVQGGELVRYRCEYRGTLVGWSTSLRVACEETHKVYLRSLAPGGPPVADWGSTPRR